MPSIAHLPELHSTVRPTRWVAVLIGLLALLSLGALWSSGLLLPLKLVLAVLLGAYAIQTIIRCCSPRIRCLAWDSKGLIIQTGSGEPLRVRLAGRPFVSPMYLGLVLLFDDGQRRHLGVFRHQLDAAFWRQSQVRLRSLLN